MQFPYFLEDHLVCGELHVRGRDAVVHENLLVVYRVPEWISLSLHHSSNKKLLKTEEFKHKLFGGPGGTRTLDTLLKRQVL